jgi:Flp pilus assembly protein TadD
LVVALAALSVGRTVVWASDERLWREAVARAPDKIRPRIQLARDVPPAEALTLLAQARRLAPGDANVATETGKVLLTQGNAAAALSEFGRALALNPRDAENYNNRGVALLALGQRDAARQDFQHALQLDPNLMEARQNLRRLGW